MKRETLSCFNYDVGMCYSIRLVSTTKDFYSYYILNNNRTVNVNGISDLTPSQMHWRFLQIYETNQIYSVLFNADLVSAWDLQGSSCLVLNNISTSPSQMFYIRDPPDNLTWCHFNLLNNRGTMYSKSCLFPEQNSPKPRFQIEQATSCPTPLPIIKNDCFEYIENTTYRIINVASKKDLSATFQSTDVTTITNLRPSEWYDVLWSFTPVHQNSSTFYMTAPHYPTVLKVDASWSKLEQTCTEDEGKGGFIISKHSKDKCYIGGHQI